ncbi:MAG: radical SAM protein [Prolixibacteraceae bacterium]
MKILMIRPKPSEETIGLQHLMIVEPLELEVLYSLIRDTDSAIIVDLILEKRSFESFLLEHQPDVVCITGYITNVSTMIDYCETAKRLFPEIKNIVGGVHCEVCPEDFEHEAIDFRVVRNAAINFTTLLNHIEKNTELPPGVFRQRDSLQNTTLPEFDFRVPLANRAAVERYRDQYFYIFHEKVALMKTSFGCPYQCSFCFCRVITGGKYNQRPVLDVIQELEQLKEKEIYMVDDDFLFDRQWLQQFIAELKLRKINKHYLVYSRADFIAKNQDLMKELAQIGLRTVIVGFESFDDKELDQYNKKTSVAMYKETMTVLNREKIDVFATIIVPHNYDKSDFKTMVTALKSLKIHFVNLQPLTPLPKTGVSFPEDQIIIDRKNYPQWDLAHVSVRPTKLSVAEFYTEILKAYNSILYSPNVLWKYLTTYKPAMLFKMLVGGYRVTKQYKLKIKEAKHA